LERLWFLASLEFIAREMGDFRFVHGGRGGIVNDMPVTVPGHLAHARRRFPDEPRFRLIAAERSTLYVEGRMVKNGRTVTDAEYADLQKRAAAVRSWQRLPSFGLPTTTGRATARPGLAELTAANEARVLAGLKQAAEELRSLEATESLREEVHLHLGAIAMIFSQPDGARRYFDNIERSTASRCVAYLGRFLRGRVDELDGRLPDAERGYRAALRIVPRAQSATTALAGLLWLNDRRSEAIALIDDQLSEEAVMTDPWASFLTGGCSEWPTFIAALRAGLQ
jgi:hypothetical protein